MNLRKLERYSLITIILALTVLNFLYSGKAKRIERGFLGDIDKNEAANTYIWQNTAVSEDLSLKSCFLIDPHSLDTISLPEFCSKSRIVMMLSQYSCEVCVDSILSAIEKSNFKDSKDLCIFFFSDNVRSTKAEIFKRKISIPVFLLVNQNLEIPAVKSGFSFFFWLDSDCKTKRVFIPDKTNNTKTIWYLNLMRHQLSS